MFQNLLKWLAPFLKPVVDGADAALLAAKPTLIAEVNALATKDAPAVAALVISKLSFGGIFGSEIKSLVGGYVTSEVSSLTSSLESADGAWFDELYAKLVAEETTLGL